MSKEYECPACGGQLSLDDDDAVCEDCGKEFRIDVDAEFRDGMWRDLTSIIPK